MSSIAFCSRIASLITPSPTNDYGHFLHGKVMSWTACGKILEHMKHRCMCTHNASDCRLCCMPILTISQMVSMTLWVVRFIELPVLNMKKWWQKLCSWISLDGCKISPSKLAWPRQVWAGTGWSFVDWLLEKGTWSWETPGDLQWSEHECKKKASKKSQLRFGNAHPCES